MNETRERSASYALALEFPFARVGYREVVFFDAEKVLQETTYCGIGRAGLAGNEAPRAYCSEFFDKLLLRE